MFGKILLLDAEEWTADILCGGGYSVTHATTAEEAAQAILDAPPDVVLIEIKPATFSGLALLRQPDKLPHFAAIVMTAGLEPFIEAEAKRHQAVYLVKPTDGRVLLMVVAQQLNAARGQRRWPRWSATGRLAARVGQSAAVVLDVSYDGLRFEIPPTAAEDLSSQIAVHLTDRHLTLAAQPVWTHRTPLGALRCGARLVQTESRQVDSWRSTVNAVACVA